MNNIGNRLIALSPMLPKVVSEHTLETIQIVCIHHIVAAVDAAGRAIDFSVPQMTYRSPGLLQHLRRFKFDHYGVQQCDASRSVDVSIHI